VQAILSWLSTLWWFVVVLGVLVFVHELGHFLMARRLGVRVLTFSLGFGPRLFGVVRKGTDYCVRAIPLGGYVKMAGENPEEPRTGTADEFLSRRKWQRFQVLIMGPLMNILLAVILMWAVLLQGADVPAFLDRPPVVGSVTTGSPAEKVGIRAGDRIVRVGGRRADTWEQFFMLIGGRADRDVPIVLLREGREITVRVMPKASGAYDAGDIGVLPDAHPHIAGIIAGQPCEKAGCKAGDIVTAVDGRRISFAAELRDAIEKHPGHPITISVTRGGVPVQIVVTPVQSGRVGKLGIQIGDEIKTIQPGPIQALGLSLERNYQFGGLIFQTVVGLLTRETSPRSLIGPVGIAEMSGEAAKAGWKDLLGLMAMISLNLGILNLLPIPVLDGGHIFIMAVEGMVRRDFSVKVKEKMLFLGFALLMALMVTVMYNDLTRVSWIEKLMFWR
jgi:regulator of sigma E protease